jgi:hypothetical protein
MARGFWEHLLALLFLLLSVFCCCGVTRYTQEYVDALVPRLGTGIGVFISTSLAAFYLVAALSAGITRSEPFRARYGVTLILAGAFLGGAGFTALVMKCFPGTNFEQHTGLFGFGLLLFTLAILPFHIIESRQWRLAQAQARQEALERIRSGAAPFSEEDEPLDE